jgi:hypothetical protein
VALGLQIGNIIVELVHLVEEEGYEGRPKKRRQDEDYQREYLSVEGRDW